MIIGVTAIAAAEAEDNQGVSDHFDFDSTTNLLPVSLNHHLEKRQGRPLRRRLNYNGFPFGQRTIGSGHLLQDWILPTIEAKVRNLTFTSAQNCPLPHKCDLAGTVPD